MLQATRLRYDAMAIHECKFVSVLKKVSENVNFALAQNFKLEKHSIV
jgi:hypothetical protein